MKEKLLGKTLEELRAAAVECGQKAFVGTQIADWLYKKRVCSWEDMRNVSSAAKQALRERYDLGTSAPVDSICSEDGTVKYLFGTGVEAVMIPDSDRKTLCVSSQVGCRMGCRSV